MFIQELLESVLRLPGQFAEIAMHDPLSAVLMAVGALITFVSVAVFGGLVAGSVLEALTPSPSEPPRRPDR